MSIHTTHVIYLFTLNIYIKCVSEMLLKSLTCFSYSDSLKLTLKAKTTKKSSVLSSAEMFEIPFRQTV